MISFRIASLCLCIAGLLSMTWTAVALPMPATGEDGIQQTIVPSPRPHHQQPVSASASSGRQDNFARHFAQTEPVVVFRRTVNGRLNSLAKYTKGKAVEAHEDAVRTAMYRQNPDINNIHAKHTAAIHEAIRITDQAHPLRAIVSNVVSTVRAKNAERTYTKEKRGPRPPPYTPPPETPVEWVPFGMGYARRA